MILSKLLINQSQKDQFKWTDRTSLITPSLGTYVDNSFGGGGQTKSFVLDVRQIISKPGTNQVLMEVNERYADETIARTSYFVSSDVISNPYARREQNVAVGSMNALYTPPNYFTSPLYILTSKSSVRDDTPGSTGSFAFTPRIARYTSSNADGSGGAIADSTLHDAIVDSLADGVNNVIDTATSTVYNYTINVFGMAANYAGYLVALSAMRWDQFWPSSPDYGKNVRFRILYGSIIGFTWNDASIRLRNLYDYSNTLGEMVSPFGGITWSNTKFFGFIGAYNSNNTQFFYTSDAYPSFTYTLKPFKSYSAYDINRGSSTDLLTFSRNDTIFIFQPASYQTGRLRYSLDAGNTWEIKEFPFSGEPSIDNPYAFTPCSCVWDDLTSSYIMVGTAKYGDPFMGIRFEVACITTSKDGVTWTPYKPIRSNTGYMSHANVITISDDYYIVAGSHIFTAPRQA